MPSKTSTEAMNHPDKPPPRKIWVRFHELPDHVLSYKEPNIQAVAYTEEEKKYAEENERDETAHTAPYVPESLLTEHQQITAKKVAEAREEGYEAGILFFINEMNESGDQDILRALHKIKRSAEAWKQARAEAAAEGAK